MRVPSGNAIAEFDTAANVVNGRSKVAECGKASTGTLAAHHGGGI
jgi:hypothetical protein